MKFTIKRDTENRHYVVCDERCDSLEYWDNDEGWFATEDCYGWDFTDIVSYVRNLARRYNASISIEGIGDDLFLQDAKDVD